MSKIENDLGVLSIIFESTHMLVAYLDTDLRFVRVNTAYATADGKEPGFFVGKKHFDLFPNIENEQIFNKVIESGDPHFSYAKPFEYEYNPERGVTHWDWSLYPSKNEAGTITGAVLQLINVTERIEAEEKLRIEQDFGDAVLESASALVAVLDNQGRIVRFNRACESLTGYKISEVKNKFVWDLLLADEEKEPVKNVFKNLTKTELSGEFTNYWIAKDGSRALIQWSNSVMTDDENNVRFVVAVGVDVTEKRRFEQSLQRSEETLKNAQSIAHIGTWDWDIRSNKLEWSEEIFNIFGVDADNFGATYEHFLEFVHKEDRPAVEKAVNESLSDPQVPYHADHRIVRANGEIRFVKETGRVYFDDTGKPIRMIGIVQDITESELAEKNLLIAQTAIETAIDPIAFGDMEGKITFCNQAFVDLWGFKNSQEVIGQTGDSFWHYGGADEEMMASLKETGSWVGDGVALLREGGSREVRIASTMIAMNEKPLCLMATFVDVSEENSIRDELQRKEQTLSDAQAIAHVGNWDWDISNGNIAWSDEIYRIFGHEAGAIDPTYEAFLKTIHEDDRQSVQDAVNDSLADPSKIYHIEHRIITPANEIRIVQEDGRIYLGEDGKPIRMIGTVQDITEQKRIEDALRESESKLNEAQQVARMGYLDWYVKENKITWSDETYRIYGFPRNYTPTLENTVELVHEDDRQRVKQALQSAITNKEEYKIDHRMIRPDGEIIYVHAEGRLTFDGNGEVIRMLGTVQDVTEQNLARAKLESSQARFKAMFESMSDAVILTDTNRRITVVNQAVVELYGYSEAELLGNFTQMLYGDDDDFLKAGLLRHKIDVKSGMGPYEILYRRKDGSVFLGETQGTQIRSGQDKVTGFVAIIRDITERKHVESELAEHRQQLERLVENRTQALKDAQAELIRKERLATLGQLTATVSHELRNPLGAMRPSLYIAQRLADPANEKLQKALERLDRNITRCDHIIDELLDFTRITTLEQSEVDIDDWVARLIEEQTTPDGIKLTQDLKLDGFESLIDSHRLRRALINVIENGFQAIEEELRRNTNTKNSEVTVFTRHQGDRIEIGVRDTGAGIADEVLPHIFEPLYSTKGFGVGLGMPTVKQIIEQHGGNIEIQTVVGKGTTIRFLIPKKSSRLQQEAGV